MACLLPLVILVAGCFAILAWFFVWVVLEWRREDQCGRS
jgi:hypothetical protein